MPNITQTTFLPTTVHNSKGMDAEAILMVDQEIDDLSERFDIPDTVLVHGRPDLDYKLKTRILSPVDIIKAHIYLHVYNWYYFDARRYPIIARNMKMVNAINILIIIIQSFSTVVLAILLFLDLMNML